MLTYEEFLEVNGLSDELSEDEIVELENFNNSEEIISDIYEYAVDRNPDDSSLGIVAYYHKQLKETARDKKERDLIEAKKIQHVLSYEQYKKEYVEIIGFTNDFEKWKLININNVKENPYFEIDIDGNLKKIQNLFEYIQLKNYSTFMMSPIGKINGNVYKAKSYKFDSYQELLEFIDNSKEVFYFYEIIPITIETVVDEQTFIPIKQVSVDKYLVSGRLITDFEQPCYDVCWQNTIKESVQNSKDNDKKEWDRRLHLILDSITSLKIVDDFGLQGYFGIMEPNCYKEFLNFIKAKRELEESIKNHFTMK